MLTLHFPWAEIQRFLFILLRVSTMTLLVPVFDSRNIPVMAKVGLCLALSFFCFHAVSLQPFEPASDLVTFCIGIAQEVMIGAMIGLVVRLLFAGIQLAGEMIGFQMGLTIANVIDPISSNQISIVSQMLYIFAILIFWAMDGHHMVFHALTDSFKLIPPFGFRLSESLGQFTLDRILAMFRMSLLFGAPMIVSLVLATLVIGLIARAVPQMNVFMVALPAKIWIGLFFLGTSLSIMASVVQKYSLQLHNQIGMMMKWMGQG